MKTKELVKSALGAALLSVSAWITVPATVPFTMQTFMLSLLLLTVGANVTLFSTLVYLLVGALGIPVFSGFGGGVGILFGPTGGYLIGFLFFPLFGLLFQKAARKTPKWQYLPCALGLSFCYLFGSLQFVLVAEKSLRFSSLLSAFSVCVLPFIPADIVKIALAAVVAKRLKTKIVS